MGSLNNYDDLDLYESVRGLLRSGKLTPEVLANFIYNRRDKLVKKNYMTDFEACEAQFQSLMSQKALQISKRTETVEPIDPLTSEKLAEMAEVAFGLFATWTWTREK